MTAAIYRATDNRLAGVVLVTAAMSAYALAAYEAAGGNGAPMMVLGIVWTILASWRGAGTHH